MLSESYARHGNGGGTIMYSLLGGSTDQHPTHPYRTSYQYNNESSLITTVVRDVLGDVMSLLIIR